MAAIVQRVADHVGTVLFVTHRPDLMRLTDVIWHLDAGRLVVRVLRSCWWPQEPPTAELERMPGGS